MTRRILTLGVALLCACQRGDGEAEAEGVMMVHTEAVASEAFPVTVGSIGVVTSRPGGVAELAAPGSSRITAIHVGPGDAVKAGELLLSLDHSVWDANVAESEAAVEAAQRAHERAVRLSEQGIGPRKDVEQAAADLARAQAALASAKRTRSLADLRSPIAGVVDSLDASLEETVAEGTVLVRVVDPRDLEVVFRLPPDQATRVHIGQAADMGPGPRDSLSQWSASGHVVAIAPGIESGSGAVPVRVAVTKSTRTLRLGEVLDGRIEVARHQNALVVPVNAIAEQTGPDGIVFTVGNDSLAHLRNVKIGARTGDRVEILQGLQAGEHVVTGGAYAVRDSTHVRVGGGS